MRLQIPKRKPKWYESGQYRPNPEGDKRGGYVYLPYADGKKLYFFGDRYAFELLVAFIDLKKRPGLSARFRKPKSVKLGTMAFDLAVAEYEQQKSAKKEEHRSKGRIVKETRRPEYSPTKPKGGRVVRSMPKQLQKMKQAQEKVEDDEA